MKTTTLRLLEGYRVQGVCQGQQQQGILTNNNQPKTRHCDGGGTGEAVKSGGGAGEVQYSMTFLGDCSYKDGKCSTV